MVTVGTEHPVAVAAVAAIHSGDVERLRRLLNEHDWLATARIGDDAPDGMSRTLLHVATDWPGHFVNVSATITALVDAGADVSGRFRGPHAETPLHWAASSDDVTAIDALLDAGADIDAPGAVLGGGSPLSDACGFRQWRAAARLVERGAGVTLQQAATMGLIERIGSFLAADPRPTHAEITSAFWSACHGGRLVAAQLLLDQGAELNWVAPWTTQTPLDAALDGGPNDLVAWLRGQGARTSAP